MLTVRVQDFDSWRSTARQLLWQGIEPTDVQFETGNDAQLSLDLAFEEADANASPAGLALVPAAFLESARVVSCHQASDRWNLLYRLVWRVTHGEVRVLRAGEDGDVARFRRLERDVRRDMHKLQAVVRFRPVMIDNSERYIAWDKPEYDILRLVAPLFAKRFPRMLWSILTPRESVSWNLQDLVFAPGFAEEPGRSDPALAALFSKALASAAQGTTSEPQRAEMSSASIVSTSSRAYVQPSLPLFEEGRDAAAIPESRDLAILRNSAARCQACSLCERATQTVFGSGAPNARLMIVLPRPEEHDDFTGEPLCGPAGEFLQDTLYDAGLKIEQIYVTYAVKHFDRQQAQRRLALSPPEPTQISACRPWLEAEIRAVAPDVIVCLGAGSSAAVFGESGRLLPRLGEFHNSPMGPQALVSRDPATILQAPDLRIQKRWRRDLISHLKTAAARLATQPETSAMASG